MRPIVEGMGLDWSNQLRTIKEDPVLSSTVVNLTTVGNDGKQREMISLPLTYLNGWLFKINSGRYKEDDPRRDTIIIYQKECYLALYDYWHKGAAVNPRAASESAKEEQRLTIGFLRKETEEAVLFAGIYGLKGNQALLSANMFVRSQYDVDCTARHHSP